jgi:hypothetical protein
MRGDALPAVRAEPGYGVLRFACREPLEEIRKPNRQCFKTPRVQLHE